MTRVLDVREPWGFLAMVSLPSPYSLEVSAAENTSLAPWKHRSGGWCDGYGSWLGAQDVVPESRALLAAP